MGRTMTGLAMALFVLWGARPVAAFQVAHDLQPVSLGARCAGEALPGPEMRIVQRALSDSQDPEVVPPLVALYDSLASEAEARPQDVELLFLLAVVMGARSEVSGGRTQLEWAERMSEVAGRILDLEEDHAGAMHLLGRIHAAVMRMGTLKRWLARTLFGGAVLKEASWQDARRYLEAAAEASPCNPDYRYELAALYRDTGRPDLAAREAQRALEVSAVDPAYEGVARKARILLSRDDGGQPESR
jgi:tetratricopeptide (TPR) repeat protein